MTPNHNFHFATQSDIIITNYLIIDAFDESIDTYWQSKRSKKWHIASNKWRLRFISKQIHWHQKHYSKEVHLIILWILSWSNQQFIVPSRVRNTEQNAFNRCWCFKEVYFQRWWFWIMQISQVRQLSN